MNKPTRAQILAEKDPKQISSWIAIHCYGWKPINCIVSQDRWWELPDGSSISKERFNPLADTVEGKAQCFELMVEFGVFPEEIITELGGDNNRFILIRINGDLHKINIDNLQEYICKAALLCVCEVE